jgi:HEAT repeat protein
MLKLLPDAPQRLGRRLASGPMEHQLKALQMTQELGLADPLRGAVTALASHPHPKVRSKAVNVLGQTPGPSVDVLMERVAQDADSRVRANAIEMLENHQTPEFIALLAERSRTANNRERANAIKALHRMRMGNDGQALMAMLQDERPEHRISAMWVLKEIGWWKLLDEVSRIARSDPNLRARRYAVAVLKSVAEMVQSSKEAG